MGRKLEIRIIVTFILIAIIISIEQYISYGVFFEIKDIHHEMFIAMFLFSALVLIIVRRFRKPKSKTVRPLYRRTL